MAPHQEDFLTPTEDVVPEPNLTWLRQLPFSHLMHRVEGRLQHLGLASWLDYLQWMEERPTEQAYWHQMLRQTQRGAQPLVTCPQLPDWLIDHMRQPQPNPRYWICGVGVGDFIYQLLLALAPHLLAADRSPDLALRIFGTDALSVLIDRARHPIFQTQELERWTAASWLSAFYPVERGWKMKSQLRRHVLLSQHHPEQHAPFTQQAGIISLLALQWLNPLQWRQLQHNWYRSLAPGGFLWLAHPEARPAELEAGWFEAQPQRPGLYLRRQAAPPARRLAADYFPHWQGALYSTQDALPKLLQQWQGTTWQPAFVLLDPQAQVLDYAGEDLWWLAVNPNQSQPFALAEAVPPALRAPLQRAMARWKLTHAPQEEALSLLRAGRPVSVKLYLRTLKEQPLRLILMLNVDTASAPAESMAPPPQHLEAEWRQTQLVQELIARQEELIVQQQEWEGAQRVAVQEARWQQDLKQALQQKIPLGTWTWDPVRQRLAGDEACYRLLQRSLDQPLLGWSSVLSPDGAPLTANGQALMAWLQEQRASAPPGFFLPGPEGGPYHGLYLLPLDPAQGQEGHPTFCRGLLLDFRTILAQAKGTSLAPASSLAESETRAPQDLEVMSHELRAPLHQILILVEMLQEETDPNEQKQLHTLLHHSAQHLHRLAENVLTQRRSRQATLDLQPEAVDLTALLQRWHQQYRRYAQQKGIAFEFIQGPTVPAQAQLDPHRLNQVVSNLLHNALQASHRGKISWEVFMERSPEREQAWLMMRISDEGGGIPPQQLTHLLQVAHQPVPSGRSGGSGLGWHIVHRILDRWGGWLDLQSIPQGGTAVLLGLPLEASPALDGPLQAGNSRPRITSQLALLRACRWLYVDDSAASSQHLRHLAQRHRMSLDVVSTGAEALAALATRRYQGLVLDPCLPDMAAKELLQHLHAWSDDFFHAFPLVVVNAHPWLSAVAEAQVPEIAKPVDFEALLDALMEQLRSYLTWQLKAPTALRLDQPQQRSEDLSAGLSGPWQEVQGLIPQVLAYLSGEATHMELLPSLDQLGQCLKDLHHPKAMLRVRAARLAFETGFMPLNKAKPPLQRQLQSWQQQLDAYGDVSAWEE